MKRKARATLKLGTLKLPPKGKISLPESMRFPLPEVYEPEEDSFLLLRAIRKLGMSGKAACDMGTGSGILANELAGRFQKVVAVDINPEALKSSFEGNVEAVESDLFEKVRGKGFELIVFNSPYLPGEEDFRWSCGNGEILIRFLREAAKRLVPNGKVLFLISSLTPKSVPSFARKLFRKVEIVGEERLPGFETLFVLELSNPKA